MPLKYGYQSAEAWSAARASVSWTTVVSSSSAAGSTAGSSLPPEGCSSFTDPASSPGVVDAFGEDPQADSSTATDTRTGTQRFASTSRRDRPSRRRSDPVRRTSVLPAVGPPTGEAGRHPG